LVVSALVLAAALLLLLRARPAGLRPLGYTLLVLLATQFTLGVLSVYLRKPADIASLHVAVGALLLVVAVALLLRVSRVYAPRHAGRGPLADATPCSTQAVVRGLVAGASPG
jgi:heme A synthase